MMTGPSQSLSSTTSIRLVCMASRHDLTATGAKSRPTMTEAATKLIEQHAKRGGFDEDPIERMAKETIRTGARYPDGSAMDQRRQDLSAAPEGRTCLLRR